MVDILNDKGIALLAWLDNVEESLINIPLGNRNGDMRVKRYSIYSYCSSVTTYTEGKASKFKVTSLYKLKGIKALSKLESISQKEKDRYYSLFNSICSGEKLPLGFYLNTNIEEGVGIDGIVCIREVHIDSQDGVSIRLGKLIPGTTKLRLGEVTYPILELSTVMGTYGSCLGSLIKVSPEGFIRPIEIVGSVTSYIIDNYFVYLKKANNKPLVVGWWDSEGIIFNKSIPHTDKNEPNKEELTKIGHKLRYIHRYIVPYGICGSHKVSYLEI